MFGVDGWVGGLWLRGVLDSERREGGLGRRGFHKERRDVPSSTKSVVLPESVSYKHRFVVRGNVSFSG